MSTDPSMPSMSGPTPAGGTTGIRWSRFVPGIAALGSGFGTIRYDLIAAITLAAYLLPSNIGDASLANLPPEAGLYACLFSGLVFWLFCSSKHTAVTVTSAISLLIGSSLSDLANGETARFAVLAECTALMVGVMFFIAWVVRAGALVNFISETVLIGFKAGVALHLASTQLPKLFGFHGAHGGDFWDRMAYFFKHLKETNSMALLLGAASLAVILVGKVLLKNKPVALLVMIAGIVLASIPNLDLRARGVEMLGNIPQGLPAPTLPLVDWSDVRHLLPLAVACFMLAAVETAAIGRTFALKHGYRLDANQEFLALAAANLSAGFFNAYPVSGGMSQSLVNESAGARTSLSGFFAACIILLVTLFLSGLLRNLPQPVLAAIVIAAVTSLFKVSALQQLWRFNRGEFAIAIAALLGVLCFGILDGVLLGALLSVVMLLRRASRPQTTELGRVPGTDYFADAVRHEENIRVSRVYIFRVNSSLLYFNVEHVRDRFMELLNKRGPEIKLAIFYMGTVPTVDLAGAELLVDLHAAMKVRGIAFRLAEAHGNVRDALRRAGYETHAAPVVANQTVADVLARETPSLS